MSSTDVSTETQHPADPQEAERSPDSPVRPPHGVAAKVVAALLARGHTVAAAESLTGGLVADAFVRVPGTSAVFLGAIVSYATEVKRDLLGVDGDLLEERGAVDADVVQQMAAGAQRVLGTTWAVATTGVAGPEGQDGKEPGCVFVGVAGPGGTCAAPLDLSGDREEIRAQATAEALQLLLDQVSAHRVPVPPQP